MRDVNRYWHRYKILLGLAAVSAFLLALPAAALACVLPSTCALGGGVVVTGVAGTKCSGGLYDQQAICGPGMTQGPLQVSLTNPAVQQMRYFRWALSSAYQNDGLTDAQYADWARAILQGQPYPAGENLGGPVSFKMYSSDNTGGPYAGADIFGIHNSGYRVSDSAGAVAAGSLAPGFNSLGGGGGLNLTVDGSRLFNQHLLFGLDFDYQGVNTSFGTSALTPGVASAGSVRNDIYTLTGTVAYWLGGFHADGMAAYDWTHNGITNNIDGGTGNTNGQGYTVGVAAGYMFPLFNTTGVTQSSIPAKAPPQPRYGGYAILLDVNGNVGYEKEWDNGFDDSTGFVFGTEQFSTTYLGGGARLVGIVPSTWGAWVPYVGVNIEQQIGFSHTLDIPAQAAMGADTIFFNQSTTYWTVQAGLDIINRASVKVGFGAFYSASGDTNIVGGNAFVKIPFYAVTAPVGDSGIRAASR